MSQEIIDLKDKFDAITVVDTENEIEFWYARDLMKELGYLSWEKFHSVIKRAMKSCETSGYEVLDHFHGAVKMVQLGSKAKRKIQDYMLTRYACYLIAQNGDPRKKEIAFAQSYFAIQTRKLELIENHMKLAARLEARERLKKSEKELSKNIYERGVDDKGFGRIRSKGDAALFGGKTTADMKKQYGVKKNRVLADFLPAVTIAAKNLATELTNYNVKDQNMYGESEITDEHVQNNKSIRNTLQERGIKPENLPAEEVLQKLERFVKAKEKKLAKSNVKLPEQTQEHREFIGRKNIDMKIFNDLSDKKQQNIEIILDYLQDKQKIKPNEIAGVLKKSVSTALIYLRILVDCGLLKVEGSRNNRVYVKNY